MSRTIALDSVNRNSNAEDEEHQALQSSARSQKNSGQMSKIGIDALNAPANSNEDWFNVSDLAARRKIQNRIAQRNYRE